MTRTLELAEGRPTTAGLIAVRHLGGGAAYEGYRALDDITLPPR